MYARKEKLLNNTNNNTYSCTEYSNDKRKINKESLSTNVLKINMFSYVTIYSNIDSMITNNLWLYYKPYIYLHTNIYYFSSTNNY